jgi:putative photosynthetic complex assembly protein 2
MAGATVILLAAGHALQLSAADASVRGAYTAFSAAILVWGWLEMSFLMGFITGPRKHACIERCCGWRHFVHATQAIIYNEIATLLGALAVFGATYAAANRVALSTYAILWAMRLSAKLNLFLGVPNLGEKFLPAHLQYLKGFFCKRPMNFLFPFSVTGATLVGARLVQKYLSAADAFQSTSYALLSSLLALAVLEHWFMVMPLPSERLWIWAFKAGRGTRGRDHVDRQLAAKAPYHPWS